eukprot:gene9359-biopygen15119
MFPQLIEHGVIAINQNEIRLDIVFPKKFGKMSKMLFGLPKRQRQKAEITPVNNYPVLGIHPTYNNDLDQYPSFPRNAVRCVHTNTYSIAKELDATLRSHGYKSMVNFIYLR